MLTSAQIRAARALLAWRQEELAKAARVGPATIHRIEQDEGVALSKVSTLVRIQQAFEKAGVVFMPEDDAGGFGVRMSRRAKSKKK